MFLVTFQVDGFDPVKAIEAALVKIDDVVALQIQILQGISKALKCGGVDVTNLVTAQVEYLMEMDKNIGSN